MSRATISTGIIDWKRDETETKDCGDSGYLLLLGDFSAAGSRAAVPTPRLQRVDRDTLDEVFAKLDVRLKLPFSDEPLHFTEMDDLHPDFLYEQVELFAEMRDLQRRLENPKTFATTAAELTSGEEPVKPSLDELLATAPDPSAAPTLDIPKLIYDIVAPHIVPAPTPQQTALQASVQEATAELMRKLLHQSGFRALEACWRGLDLLLRRLDGDREPRLFLVDCPAAHLPQLLATGGALEGLLQSAGLLDSAPTLIVADYRYGGTATDLASAAALAEFAQRRDCVALGGGDERLAGCRGLSADPDDWNTFDATVKEAWDALRSTPAAQYLALIAPRFLLRAPYGKRTATTDLGFEEWVTGDSRTLPWGNGVWLAALARCNDDDSVAALPLPPSTGIDESRALSSAETLLSDRAASRLKAAGLMPLRAERDSDRVYFAEWTSCYLESRD